MPRSRRAAGTQIACSIFRQGTLGRPANLASIQDARCRPRQGSLFPSAFYAETEPTVFVDWIEPVPMALLRSSLTHAFVADFPPVCPSPDKDRLPVFRRS